jgi:hypothetical protein
MAATGECPPSPWSVYSQSAWEDWASRAVTGRRMLHRNADGPVQSAVQLDVKIVGQLARTLTSKD